MHTSPEAAGVPFPLSITGLLSSTSTMRRLEAEAREMELNIILTIITEKRIWVT